MSENQAANEEEIILPDSQQEDEGDLSGNISFKEAIVMNTDWTIDTLNNQITKGNIDLEPSFQRRSAWDDIRKSKLIESMIVGIPVPSIVLAENKERKGRFIVIDGKQRLVSINDFYKGVFKLKKLDIRPDLNNKYYGELPEEDREFLDNNTFRSTLIRNWVDDDFLYTIFYRLNSGSLALSPQELRKALIGGSLLNYIEDYILNSNNFKSVFGENLDKRMRDSELVLRFISYELSVNNYGGNLKVFLDTVVKEFEHDWDSKKNKVDSLLKSLDLSLYTTHEIFGKDAFKKWTEENRYEKTINRAVFDALARFFGQQHVSDAALANKDLVIETYQATCLIPEFKSAVEKTTKTRESVDTRINLWGYALAGVLGMQYDPDEKRVS
jgi:hypothetical protein